MSMVLTKQPNWKAVLNGKARLVHQQIASLQRWVEDAGGGKKMLDELSAPYYDLLQSIYEEDFPLASNEVERIDYTKLRVAPKAAYRAKLGTAKSPDVKTRLLARKNKKTPKKRHGKARLSAKSNSKRHFDVT